MWATNTHVSNPHPCSVRKPYKCIGFQDGLWWNGILVCRLVRYNGGGALDSGLHLLWELPKQPS